MSASLFIFAINPILVHFSQALIGKHRGEVRACADDIGICLQDFRSLKLTYIVFDFAKIVSGMNLKPNKCNITPLNQVDRHFQDCVRGRISFPSGSKIASQNGIVLWLI